MGLSPKNKVVTVVSSGSPVPLLAAGDKMDGIIQAVLQVQSGTVFLGDSSVSYANSIGHRLVAGFNDTIDLLPADGHGGGYDLAKVYIDAAADGTKVNLLYFTRL